MHSDGYPIDLVMDEPGYLHFARRLGRFSRAVFCDGRGTAASAGNPLDRFRDELVVPDITARLEAVGFETAVLVGYSFGGPSVIRFAIEHPERVSALVLADTFAHYIREPEYPIGLSPEMLDRFLAWFKDEWGSGVSVRASPSMAADNAFRERMARYERLAVSPGDAAVMLRMGFQQDARPLLSRISVPTLVLHRTGNPYIRVDAGRYLASHIPHSRYIEMAGNDHHLWSGDVDSTVDEIEDFLTGSRQGPEGDVITTTILFTDIVSSTQQAAKMGHRKWTTLTDAHDLMVRAALQHHRGVEVKTLGDGFLATFDSTSRAVRAAKEIVRAASDMGVDVRAGVHTGEVEVRPRDLVGLSVSIAKRVCDLAGAGEILVSDTVPHLVTGSNIEFQDRGEHDLRGVPGSWRLFLVKD